MSEDEQEAAPRPTLAHRLEYAAFRSVEGLLGLMSLETVTRIGGGLGLVAWALSPGHRRLVRRNLRIATAAEAPDTAQLDAMVRETFRRAGGNLLASQRAATLPAGVLRDHIEFKGLEHLLTPIRAGRGVVLVWSHMGNWEVLAQLIRETGEEIEGGPIYRPLGNPLLDELTVQRRTQEGAVLFNKHDGFNGPAALLRRGGVVTVMTDQRAGGHGELCPFFGRLSSCTPLPALLARRTGSAMATLSITSRDAGKWLLTLRPVPEKAKTAEVLGHLETAMRDRLTDVFWFHDRWRVDKMVPLGFFTKVAPAEAAAAATQPVRLVATLPPGDADAVEALITLLELRPDSRIDVLDTGHLPHLPDHPGLVRFPADHSNGLLDRCDASHATPLDFALLLDGDVHLASEAKRLGLRAIVGASVSGKPWTRSIPRPTDRAGWREFATKLVLTAKSRKAVA